MNTRFFRFLFGTIIAGVIALTLFVLPKPSPARAGGVVTNCTEAGLDAALSGGGTVTFNCNGDHSPATIDVNSQKTISVTTTIDGSNGGNTVAIGRGMTSTRIFSVTGGTALTLTNLILEDGIGLDGGCIYSNGALVLNGVQIIHCTAGTNTHGGGIYVNSAGSAALINSSVMSSTAAFSGGGVYNLGGLTVTNSYFSHNFALDIVVGGGAGIWSNGITRIDGSTFYSNTAVYGSGGGIYNQNILSVTNSTLSSNFADYAGGGIDNHGTMMLTDTNFISNTASSYGGGIYQVVTATLSNVMFNGNSAPSGGGIYNYSGAAMLSSVTLNGNSARSGSGIFNSFSSILTVTNGSLYGNYTFLPCSNSCYGGGIYNQGTTMLSRVTLNGNSAAYGGGINNYQNTGLLTLTNVTISANSAITNGGGIWNGGTITATNATLNGNSAAFGGGIYNASGTVALVNTIVANSPVGGNCSASLFGDANLSSDNTCGFGVNRNNVDVMLAPLGNYGGPTRTHIPKPGSLAMDNGDNLACPSTDQRGKPRPVNNCDVGAVERQLIDFSYWLNLPLILR